MSVTVYQCEHTFQVYELSTIIVLLCDFLFLFFIFTIVQFLSKCICEDNKDRLWYNVNCKIEGGFFLYFLIFLFFYPWVF